MTPTGSKCVGGNTDTPGMDGERIVESRIIEPLRQSDDTSLSHPTTPPAVSSSKAEGSVWVRYWPPALTPGGCKSRTEV